MTDIDRLKKLSGIREDAERDAMVIKIQNGISNYVAQEKGHHWPFGFERELSEFIMDEIEREEPKNNMPHWGDRT